MIFGDEASVFTRDELEELFSYMADIDVEDIEDENLDLSDFTMFLMEDQDEELFIRFQDMVSNEIPKVTLSEYGSIF